MTIPPFCAGGFLRYLRFVKIIGTFPEFFDLEKGIYKDFNFTVEKIKQHTRNFAKRQITYFKSNKDIKLIQNTQDILKDLDCA